MSYELLTMEVVMERLWFKWFTSIDDEEVGDNAFKVVIWHFARSGLSSQTSVSYGSF